MEKYGFQGAVHEIVKSYLRDRVPYVNTHGCKSSRRRSETEIPKGSAFGQLFFISYINDLPDNISEMSSETIVMFADDTTIIKSVGDIDVKNNADLENVGKSFSTNN